MDFSYSSVKTAVKDRLTSLGGWNVLLLGLGVFERLIDAIAYGINKIGYYADFVFTNSFLKTATYLPAVKNKAWQFNYKPHRKIGASGYVKVSGDPTFESPYTVYTGNDVSIPKWSTFTDADKTINLYSTSQAIYSNGVTIAYKNINTLSLAVQYSATQVAISLTNHQMPVGQTVSIRNTINYDGDYVIQLVPDADTIVITAEHVAETFIGTEIAFTGHIYVPVKEGIPRQFLYTAAGVVDEQIYVFSTAADNDEVEVFLVDDNLNVLEQVTIVDDQYIINDLTKYYCTVDSMSSFEGFIVTFGNGTNIKSTSTGNKFLIKYAETLGASGGVYSIGLISDFSSVIFDTNSNIPDIYVTNDEVIVSGKDYEEIDNIKQQSRSIFQAGNRAHAPNDWLTILKNHPHIHNAITWTDYDLGNTSIAFSNSYVYCSAISSTGNNLTVSQQADVLLYLKPDKQSLTDIVKFTNISAVNLRLQITAKLMNVPASTVLTNIQTELSSLYSILNTDYKNSIYESVLTTNLMQSDSNLVYIILDILHCERSEIYDNITNTVASRTIALSNTSIDEPDNTKQVYIKEGSVQIWIVRKIAGVWQNELQIGECDNIVPTSLIGMNGYNITGGIVNYTTNQISYNLTDIISSPGTYGVLNPTDLDALGYTLKIVYKTEDGNGNFTNDIRLPFFYNITDFKNDDLTFNYTYN